MVVLHQLPHTFRPPLRVAAQLLDPLPVPLQLSDPHLSRTRPPKLRTLILSEFRKNLL